MVPVPVESIVIPVDFLWMANAVLAGPVSRNRLPEN